MDLHLYIVFRLGREYFAMDCSSVSGLFLRQKTMDKDPYEIIKISDEMEKNLVIVDIRSLFKIKSSGTMLCKDTLIVLADKYNEGGGKIIAVQADYIVGMYQVPPDDIDSADACMNWEDISVNRKKAISGCFELASINSQTLRGSRVNILDTGVLTSLYSHYN